MTLMKLMNLDRHPVIQMIQTGMDKKETMASSGSNEGPDKISNKISNAVPRSGAQLLTARQIALLEQIAEVGTLAHSRMKIQTAGTLIGRGYIVPSPDGRGVCLTSEGRTIYEEILQSRLATLQNDADETGANETGRERNEDEDEDRPGVSEAMDKKG